MWTDEIAQELVLSIEDTVIPALRADTRFVDAEKLIGSFVHHVTLWRNGGQARAFVDAANELAVATELLKLDPAERITLKYEPRLRKTAKSFDFLILYADGHRYWVDVKTVAPLWKDDEEAWQRFERIASELPENAQIIVHRDWCGAAISGEEIKARWSLIRRTIEVEDKVALLDEDEKGPVRLLVCSNGGLHKDALEDFADFYFSRRFREDDWARNAVARYIADAGITFACSLAGFCFLERPWDKPLASDFAIDVRGPKLASEIA